MSSSANWLVKSHYPYSDWMLSQISSSASRFVNRTWARVWNQSMCHKSITTGSQSVARWWVAFWQFEYRTADRMASFMHRHHLLEVKTEKAETSKWQAVFNIPASPNPNALSDIFADIPRLLSMAFPAWQPTLEMSVHLCKAIGSPFGSLHVETYNDWWKCRLRHLGDCGYTYRLWGTAKVVIGIICEPGNPQRPGPAKVYN